MVPASARREENGIVSGPPIRNEASLGGAGETEATVNAGSVLVRASLEMSRRVIARSGRIDGAIPRGLSRHPDNVC